MPGMGEPRAGAARSLEGTVRRRDEQEGVRRGKEGSAKK